MNLSDTSLRIKAVTSATLDQPLSLDPVRIGVDETLFLPDASALFSATLVFETGSVEATLDLKAGGVTVTHAPVAAAAAGAGIEVASVPLEIGMTLTVNGTLYTVSDTPGAGNILQSGDTESTQAAEIVAAINGTDGHNTAHTTVSAVLGGTFGSVVLTAKTAGTAGNAYTLAKGGTGSGDISISGATFSGGVDRVLGVVLTAGDGQDLDRKTVDMELVTTLVIIVNGGPIKVENVGASSDITFNDGTNMAIGCANGIPLLFVDDGSAVTLISEEDGPTTVKILAYGNASA